MNCVIWESRHALAELGDHSLPSHHWIESALSGHPMRLAQGLKEGCFVTSVVGTSSNASDAIEQIINCHKSKCRPRFIFGGQSKPGSNLTSGPFLIDLWILRILCRPPLYPSERSRARPTRVELSTLLTCWGVLSRVPGVAWGGKRKIKDVHGMETPKGEALWHLIPSFRIK
jgi:hypothetical protein